MGQTSPLSRTRAFHGTASTRIRRIRVYGSCLLFTYDVSLNPAVLSATGHALRMADKLMPRNGLKKHSLAVAILLVS